MLILINQTFPSSPGAGVLVTYLHL